MKAEIGSVDEERFGTIQVTPGNRFGNAPKYSGYASLSYDFELFGMDAAARADTYWVAKSWNTAANNQAAAWST